MDLRDELSEAVGTVKTLHDRIKQLETENSTLIQTVKDHENIREQDRNNIRAAFQRNLNDKDGVIEDMRDEIAHLRGNIDFRDAEVQRLREQQQPKKYEVPLPQQVNFDGSSSYVAFIRQFQSLSQACRWDDREKAFRLLSSLRGEAAEFVFNQVKLEDQRSYRILEQALEGRFRERRSTASYLAVLENIKLQSREKLTEYVAEIRSLVRNGYPTADEVTLDTICLRYFIKGLGDSHMALAVGMKDPRNVDEAREILETYYSLKDETRGPKLRMVRQPGQEQKPVSEAQFTKFKKEVSEKIDSKFEQIMEMMKSGSLRQSYPWPVRQETSSAQPEVKKRDFKRRDISSVECFKCHKMGHYAKDCPDNVQVVNTEENW